MIAPLTARLQPGAEVALTAPSPQFGIPGTRYLFNNWSNGGPQQQTITVPPSDATYIASYDQENLLTLFATPAEAAA